jgi:hypothetical protein
VLCSYKACRPTCWDQQLGSILLITLNGITVTDEKHVLTSLTHMTGRIDCVLFQIARLYRPLSASASDYSDEEDELSGTQLLPTHNFNTTKPGKNARLADVWDEREELFGVGPDSDDENEREVGTSGPPAPQTPRIVVTHS